MAEHRKKALTVCRSGAKVPKALPDGNRRKVPTSKGRSTCCLGECLLSGPADQSREAGLLMGLVSGQGPYRHHPACTLFESCHAPLCPLDAASLKGVWYADEEICRSRTYANLPWVRGQRKIGRVGARGYFTLEMLRINCIVKRGIAGLDADAEEEPQLRRWLADHPERRGMSEEKKATLRQRAQAGRFWEKR
jgi:hypothetical protein